MSNKQHNSMELDFSILTFGNRLVPGEFATDDGSHDSKNYQNQDGFNGNHGKLSGASSLLVSHNDTFRF